MPTSTTLRDRRRRETLLRQAAGLVRPIALAYAKQSPECVDDLNQVGLLGMVRAAELYDSSLGVPFTCFARPHVRGAILHYLRDQAPLVRLPRRQDEWRQQLARGRGVLRAGTPEASTTALQDRLATVRQWAALVRPLPLETIDNADRLQCFRISGEPDEPAEQLEDSAPYAPIGLSPVWHNAPVNTLLGLVDRRKQQVLRRVVLKGWSYRRTAQSLGMSAPTVQRLLHAALAELRQGLSTPRLSLQGPGGRRRARSAPQVW